MNFADTVEKFMVLVPGLVGHLLSSVVIIVVMSFLCKFVGENGVVAKWLYSKADVVTAKTMGHIILRSLRMIVIIIGVLTLAGEWGCNLKAVLASLGIVSMALALAAQDIVKNFIGAFVIVVENIFKVGDKISVGGVTGIVESINFRSTQIRTDEGNLVYVPNANFSSSNVTRIANNVKL